MARWTIRSVLSPPLPAKGESGLSASADFTPLISLLESFASGPENPFMTFELISWRWQMLARWV